MNIFARTTQNTAARLKNMAFMLVVGGVSPVADKWLVKIGHVLKVR